MRTDYILYIVAVACFVIAGYSASASFMANAVVAIVLAAVGIIFIWGGYSLRPSASVLTRAEPVIAPTKTAIAEEPVVMTTSAPAPPEPVPEPVVVATAPDPEPTPVVASIPETVTPMPEPAKTEETPRPEPVPPAAKLVRKRRARKKA